MSLATTGIGGAGAGAGAGAGGLTMAHQASAASVAHAPQQHTTANASSTGTAPPPSMAALGADLIDKNQTGLSLKQVRSRQHLPIVAIDLFSGDGTAAIAYFPKKPEDPSKGEPPLYVGTVSSDIVFQSNSETAHKSLRKFLSKSKNFLSFQEESLASEASSTPVSKNKKGKTPPKESTTVILKKPHHWLGLRRIEQAPNFLLESIGNKVQNTTYTTSNELSHAIAEDSCADVGISIENSTLDGVSAPQNDDFDRVVAKVRLHSNKKSITVLPEEASQILFHTAQHMVADKISQSSDAKAKNKNIKTKKIQSDNGEDDEIIEYPVAVALPAWAMHDSAIEAIMDATEGTGVVFPRSIAATAGALLPSLDGIITPIISRINSVRAALQKQHQKQQAIEQTQEIFEDVILLLVFGMTDTGFECTAIQISSPNLNNISCLFGDLKVLSNVSYQDADPISVMEKCCKELEKNIESVAPESDGPTGIIFYGSADEQEKMKNKWISIKDEQKEWKSVPNFVTPADSVARGLAVMGAVAHGRLTKLTMSQNSSGKKKIKTNLGIRVQNVALVAVGVAFNYHGDEENADEKWTQIKTIFDFDRQTPAGPHSIDLNAAECAVRKERGNDEADSMSDDVFLKATSQFEGAKGIPVREVAALNLRVQVFEKWNRDGEWIKVGDPMEPLVIRSEHSETKDGQEKRTACEAIVLELGVSVTGLLTSSLVGERYDLPIWGLFASITYTHFFRDL